VNQSGQKDCSPAWQVESEGKFSRVREGVARTKTEAGEGMAGEPMLGM